MICDPRVKLGRKWFLPFPFLQVFFFFLQVTSYFSFFWGFNSSFSWGSQTAFHPPLLLPFTSSGPLFSTQNPSIVSSTPNKLHLHHQPSSSSSSASKKHPILAAPFIVHSALDHGHWIFLPEVKSFSLLNFDFSLLLLLFYFGSQTPKIKQDPSDIRRVCVPVILRESLTQNISSKSYATTAIHSFHSQDT